MRTTELKVARIGNSRGVRLPADTLDRYRIGDRVIMEERPEGILLRAADAHGVRLSWEETAQQMSVAKEDWSDWDVTNADGLGTAPWKPAPSRRVAEPAAEYKPGKRRRNK